MAAVTAQGAVKRMAEVAGGDWGTVSMFLGLSERSKYFAGKFIEHLRAEESRRGAGEDSIPSGLAG